MANERKVRWGILGCGKIAQKFADDLLLHSQAYLVACASRDAVKSKIFASKYGAPKYFSSYDDLVKCQDVDVIYIATPHSFHEEHAQLCLNHKKGVLCEKPMAINLAEVSAMIQSARVNDVLLMEAMWSAFLPSFVQLKHDILRGEIGEIRHINADFGFKSDFDPHSRLYNPDLAGGSLLDIGIYPIFICLFLLGYPDEIVSKATISTTGVDSECTILLQYKNGATASLYSTITTNTDTSCQIFGTEGNINIPTRFHEQSIYTLQKNGCERINIDCPKVGWGYYHEINHIHECIMSDVKESPIITFEMSQNLIKLMDEVRSQIGLSYPMEDI